MIDARCFVEAARSLGFRWYAGVPCSYLTPFINYVLQDASLRYVSMANEGDAVALMAGISLGGGPGDGPGRGITMMQNSGLGNAVSPLTSLTWIFRLPQLLIVTWRGQPGVADEPQHALMGPITPTLLDTMKIPWELFPTDPESVPPVLARALASMEATGRPYALLMQKGSVAPYALDAAASVITRAAAAQVTAEQVAAPPVAAPQAAAHVGAPQAPGAHATLAEAPRPTGLAAVSRARALREVIARTPTATTAVLASTGYCGRELYAIDDRPNQLYMVGSMGCVLLLALGLALDRPDLQVLAVDGDGAALMRMGAFATVGAYGPPNLRHLLLDNGAHDSTGGQATVSPLVSFAGIAAACGYSSALETDDVDRIGGWLEESPASGPRFARLFIRSGTPADLPRPSMTPVEVRTRLMTHFQFKVQAH